jgi:cytochrome c-type biogenesis protein CcmH/NrfG
MTEQAESRPDQPARAARPSRRRWRIAAGLVAGVLVVALAVWLGWRRPRPEPPLPDLTEADEEVVEAIQEARREVLGHPTSSRAWGRLGQVFLTHDFSGAANRCLRQAELLDPSEPAWPYLQGLNLAPTDPEASIPCLERAVWHSGDGVVVPRLLLAEVLLERGRLDEGQALLDRAHQTHPDEGRALLGLGRLALLRRDWRGGLAHLEACRDDVHARKRACSLRAEAWTQLGEPERARAEQRRWEELPEDQPWPDPWHEEVLKCRRGLRARFQSVDQLLQSGQVQDAVELLQATLDRYPQSVEAWMRLGGIWFRAQKADRAEACYRQAVHAAPDMAEAWFRLGCVQYLVHSREADDSFRRAIRLKPDHAQAHFNLAQSLKERGKRDEAAAEFRAALRCRPDYDRARTALKELEAGEGKPR